MNQINKQKHMYIIDPDYLYTVNEIGSDIKKGGLCLIPSRTKNGSYMNRESIRILIEKKMLHPAIKPKIAKNGNLFLHVKGSEILRYIKEEVPKRQWHDYMRK